MINQPPFQAARTPRTLWVELTSKCPFDCIFCSRQLRRGAGQRGQPETIILPEKGNVYCH